MTGSNCFDDNDYGSVGGDDGGGDDDGDNNSNCDEDQYQLSIAATRSKWL